jgi:hypothetical protein
MQTTSGQAARGNMGLLWARLAVLLLTIPLARMNLGLDRLISNYSFGFMSRLGVCFGIVVLVWTWGFTRQLFSWRSPVFIVASVISANIAYASDRAVPDRWFILAIVITGAIFLSVSQKLILEYSWPRMIAASIAAPGLFYLVLYSLAFLSDSTAKSMEDYWPYVWQLGYLLGMFVIPDFFEKDPLLAAA